MKKISALLMSLVAAFTVVGFTACGETPAEPTTYKVTYVAGEGTGTAPEEKSYEAGTEITVAENTFTYEGYTFTGWLYNETVYEAGAKYTVPEANTVFTAQWEANGPDAPTTYKVTYVAGGGTGAAPTENSYEAGAQITLAANTFTYDGFTFAGWIYNDTVYEAGATFTVPAENVEFTAKWNGGFAEPEPSFSQESYEYDKLGGLSLTLPLDLDGSNLFYVEVNGEMLSSVYYSYDTESLALVISGEFALTLAEGDHTVLAVTDSDAEVSCTVTVMQSLKTEFDEVTLKHFTYGVDEGVTFSVEFNTTTPVKLTQGDIEVPSEYYTYDEDSFTVKAGWLTKNVGVAEYRVYLSNNDSYAFSVSNNVIFATDYDVNTIHDAAVSTVGHNPLYQYSPNVSIVDGPEGMSGKVLKYQPNYEEVTYSCHGIYTLRNSKEWDSTWYSNVSFNEGKYYAVSFDYMTVDSTVGQFIYKSQSSGWSQDLLIGAENDGVVHHFSAVLSYEEVGNGVFLWAFWENGTGYFYVDNFMIAEIDAAPSITAGGDYNGSGDYTLDYDSAGLAFTVKLNGTQVEATYDEGTGKLTIPEAAFAGLNSGVATVTVVTAVAEYSVPVRIVDNRVSVLKDTSVNYSTVSGASVKLYGSFDPTLELVSLKVVDTAYDNGYSGGWEFSHYNTQINYADKVNFVPALNDEGYIEITSALADLFWGATQFTAEFSNGSAQTFTVNVADVLFYSNYDETTIRGNYNGGWKDSPLESGMWGGAKMGVEEVSEGNNAWVVRSTQGAADANAFSIRMIKPHPWEWYNVIGNEQSSYRVTFTYQISGLEQDSVYFYIMSGGNESKEDNFFGDYDALDYVSGDNYHKVRYNLIADGEVHTFDSGWFNWDSALRMMKIQLPKFEAADGRFVMIDEYRIISTAKQNNILSGLGEYLKGQSGTVSFDTAGYSVSKITLNGAEFTDYTVDGNVVTFNKEKLDAMDSANYNLVVYTADGGVYKASFAIADNRAANLTETVKDVYYGKIAKLAGEFDASLEVVSVTRQGADDVWDASHANPVQISTSYVTVEEDGLVLSLGLINHTYRTGKYTVTFNNGKTVEFTLNSNVIYYSDYDETNVYVNIGGNSVISQDSAMRSVVEVDGNHMIKYQPEKATLGHSTGALNGGKDNFIFTFENRTLNNYNWYSYNFTSEEIIIFFFDYEVVAGEKNPNYQFGYQDATGAWNWTKLTGKGNFYIELFAENVRAYGINCPAASIEDVRDTYMLIDNIGFGKKAINSLTLSNYDMAQTEAYTVDVNGLDVTAVKVNGNDFAYTVNNGEITLDATALKALALGEYQLIVYAGGEVYRGTFTVVDNRVVATLNDLTANYQSQKGNTVKLYGSFSENAIIEGIYRVQKTATGQERAFAQDDTTINYASKVTFVKGLDGAGYIEIPTSMLDILWGTSQYVITFNSGVTQNITITSDTAFYTDYDETGMYAKYDDGSLNFSHEMNSGLFTWNGCVAALQEREAGNKAFYVLNSENAEAPSIFTIKTHDHVWGWYQLNISEGAFRVQFTYQISGLEQGSVFFYVMSIGGESKENNFYGNYDELVFNQNDNYHQVRWYLNTDGNVHTFDSGWINANTTLRMMQINVSKFAPADGRFVMIDDYRITKGATATNILSDMGDYAKGQEEAYGFDTTGKSISKILVNGAEFTDYTVDGGVVTFSKEKLSAMECASYSIIVYTNSGTYRGTFAVTDARVANLTETEKRIAYGEEVKLAGEFDTTLTVTSVTRQGADSVWDASHANPVQLKTSYVTVTADGLELSLDLTNRAYKSGKYTVSFDNGKTVEFTLNSNVIYYSDYDETNVYVNIGGNSVICQDSSMRELVEVDGNHMLKYTPEDATLGHSTGALSGGKDNFFLTFENRTNNNYNWYSYNYKSNDTVIFFFDYEIVAGDKTPNYQAGYLDLAGTWHMTKLTGSGTFYMEEPAANVKAFGLNCPAATPDEVAGTYMLVDKVGFGVLETTKYLTETSKTVVQGTDTAITLAGSFGSDVAIEKVTRWGTNFWDASKTVLTEINKDYFTLSENGLTVSAALLNKVYDTMYFCVNLTNGDFVKFSLTSNVWWLSDYDDVYTHELSQGNVASCQDTSMWSVETAEDGNKYIKYAPEKATLGHATGGFDKRCFTFSNSTTGNTWWWQHALPTTGKLFVKFDYEVVITEAYTGGETVPPYEFRYWNVGGEHPTAISGSGTFYIEIPLEGDAPGAWAIGCRSTALAEYAGTYMNIDNYMFGVID